MMKSKLKSQLKRFWHFLWEDDSLLSWIVNIVLAFLLIKFIIYPGLGFALGTTHPVVAVVSESMEHRAVLISKQKYAICGKSFDSKQKIDFDLFWEFCGSWYESKNIGISHEAFRTFSFKNGFNKGDIIVLKGKKPENIELGDVMVFRSKKPDPIIHRVVRKWQENGNYYFQTKGDHNAASINDFIINEARISENQIIGIALFRIPALGYIKIGFVNSLCYPVINDFARIFNKELRCNRN